MLKILKKTSTLFLIFFITSYSAFAGDHSVIRGQFKKYQILTGNLKARKSENFMVPLTNTWQIQIKWLIPEGTEVKQGDVIARFDTSNIVSEIENLENTLQSLHEQKEQKIKENQHQALELKHKTKEADINYKKAELDASILPSLVSAQEYDQKQYHRKKMKSYYENAILAEKLETQSLNDELKKLDIEILENRDNLNSLKKDLDQLILKSGTEGVIVYGETGWPRRKVQIGDNVQATEKIAEIPDLDSMIIEAWLCETDINNVKIGNAVEIILDAYPNRQFKGNVTNIFSNAEKKNLWGNARFIEIEVTPEALSKDIMKPGMSARCIVSSCKIDHALMVPLEYVIFYNSRYWIKSDEIMEIRPAGINSRYMYLTDESTELEEGTELNLLSERECERIQNHEAY